MRRVRSVFFFRAAIAISCAVALCGIHGARPAFAQGKGALGKPAPPQDPKDKARELYKEGAKAIEDGKHAEGLALLEKAEALFHAPTHLLLIAKARVGLGRLVEARDAYQKIVDEQLPPKASDGFKDAKATAKSEIVVLDKRIPKLRLKLEPSDAPGLTVTMNGQPVGADRMTDAFAVDPGSYVFEAKAEGLEAARITVEATEQTTADVRLVLNKIGEKKPSVVEPEAPQGGMSGMKIAGIALMAVGGAGLAGGGAFGVLHFTTTSSADDKYAECGASCQADVESLDNDAALFGNISIGALAGGAALLGTGIVLFAVSPAPASDDAPSAAPTARVHVTPSGVSVSGTF